MIELTPCTIAGIFGPVASGKTFLTKQWIAKENRVVVFDATGEFVEDTSLSHVWASPKELLLLLKQSPYFFRVAYEPGRDLLEDFAWVSKVLWVHRSHKLLVVDEFHLICPVNSVNEDANILLRFARHDKLGFVGVSQRIADVHKLFTASCRVVILFWTQEARDLEAIRDRFGRDAEHDVAALRPLIYDDVSEQTKQIPQCLVCIKGQQPKVFDFQSDAYV